jgi:hypothetical protein
VTSPEHHFSTSSYLFAQLDYVRDTFRAGIAATMTRRSQLKVEVIDTLKTRPPTDLVQKNDVALVCAIVYKF